MMNPLHDYQPPATLDESIQRRAEWSPVNRDHGSAALILTATMKTLEAATLLGAVRAAFGLGPFDSTITNAPITEESEAA